MNIETAGLVVMLGYCSLPTGQCSIITISPTADNPAFTLAECRLKAEAFNLDKANQSKLIAISPRKLPPPYKTRVVCGTKEEGDELRGLLSPEG